MSTIAQPAPPRTTARGTPCAASWDDAWVAQVEARERAMDRRICGARTIGGKPCPLMSDHASGRCRHHGGFPLAGAPEDNPSGAFLPSPVIRQKAASGRIPRRT